MSRTRSELIEALNAPMPDPETAQKRLSHLCTAGDNEADAWRKAIWQGDPVVVLENCRLREAIARRDIQKMIDAAGKEQPK